MTATNANEGCNRLAWLLVVVAISFKFYCKFYCKFYFICDQSLSYETDRRYREVTINSGRDDEIKRLLSIATSG